MNRESGMLVTIEAVIAEDQVAEPELIAWIEQKWVLPLEEGGILLFSEADRARIKLILELRGDLAINDEAMPVVLQLLDQIYDLRRTLGDVRQAIARLPEELRGEIEKQLRWDDGA